MPTMNSKKSSSKKIAAKKPAAKKPAKKPAKNTVKKATQKAVKTVAAKFAATPAALVAVGAKAPDFTLPDAAGKLVTLSAFKGKPVVVYFYPKDDTSGCTQEACDFRDNLAQFKKLGCTVLGISPDSVKSHAKFATKHGLTVTLLADEPDAAGTPAVCAQFGVWQEKSMYGRAYMGVVRTTFVVAKDGTIAQRFDKVSVTGHVDDVLACVKQLA
jgi:peroxiredoxin Q/BCP